MEMYVEMCACGTLRVRPWVGAWATEVATVMTTHLPCRATIAPARKLAESATKNVTGTKLVVDTVVAMEKVAV